MVVLEELPVHVANDGYWAVWWRLACRGCVTWHIYISNYVHGSRQPPAPPQANTMQWGLHAQPANNSLPALDHWLLIASMCGPPQAPHCGNQPSKPIMAGDMCSGTLWLLLNAIFLKENGKKRKTCKSTTLVNMWHYLKGHPHHAVFITFIIAPAEKSYTLQTFEIYWPYDKCLGVVGVGARLSTRQHRYVAWWAQEEEQSAQSTQSHSRPTMPAPGPLRSSRDSAPDLQVPKTHAKCSLTFWTVRFHDRIFFCQLRGTVSIVLIKIQWVRCCGPCEWSLSVAQGHCLQNIAQYVTKHFANLKKLYNNEQKQQMPY